LQAGQVDHGYIPYGASEVGLVLEAETNLPGTPGWATSDWNAPIAPIYEIAPVGTELGISNYDRLIARIRGYGQLNASYVAPDGTATPLDNSVTKTLYPNPTNDIETGGFVQGTFYAIRLAVNDWLNWFSLKRLGLFSKPSETPFRGK
jgi:hypothetical protein